MPFATACSRVYATVGLNQSAVHVTKLGLVGNHRPRGGGAQPRRGGEPPGIRLPSGDRREELFHSFAGVPIVRKERAIGVLAVQHAEPPRL